MRPATILPKVWPGSPGRFESRNHSASIGAPTSMTAQPDCSRKIDARPSAATVKSAWMCNSSPRASARTPFTSPSSLMKARASVSISRRKPGKRRPRSARKFKKSHCGMNATNLHGPGTCEKSAILTTSPDMLPESVRISECRNVKKSSSNPSSWSTVRVDG